MGCQNVCQNSEVEQNYIVNSQNDPKTNKSTKYKSNPSRNLHQQNENKTTYSYRCSMNITETLTRSDFIRFEIKASNVHQMIPIWIEADSSISFSVAGSWGFEEKEELFTSVGCEDFQERPLNMLFGCLVGYIGKGPFFTVYNGLTIESAQRGPLYMFQNNGLYSVTPKGYLEVEIRGGYPKSVYEIEKILGWDLKILDTSIEAMKEDERQLLILVNKVRSDPRRFAEQYLNSQSTVEAEVELYDILVNSSPIQLLSTSLELYAISTKHAKDLGENQLAGHISSNGLDMEQRLKEGNILSKVFAENCIFGFNDPLEILLKLLIDEDNEDRNQRKIILTKDFNMVGLAIQAHGGEFCWSCIQDFIQEF